MHYRDIRKRNGHFKILQDKSVSHSFLSDVQSILRNIDYKVALSVIDKRAQIQEYGKTADDPYVISFNFLIERLINESKDGLAAEIIVERRGKKEDEQLPETWIRIYRRGLYGIQATAVQGKIREFKMNYKHDNISGLQLADLVVSSLSRKFRHPDKKEDFFELVSQKIMDDNGDVAGYGIKVFPRNSTLGKTISPLF